MDPHVLLADAYDRAAFARAIDGLASAAELRERGARLFHFDALLDDLFAALFKLVVRERPQREIPAAAALNRRLLAAVRTADGFAALKDRTALDAARAAQGALALARRALATVRSGEIFSAEELAAAQVLSSEEEALDRESTAAEELGEQGGAGRRLAEQARARRRRVDALSRDVTRTIEEAPPSLDEAVRGAADALPGDLDQAEAAAQGFATGVGGEVPGGAAARLRLAEQLRDNEKLARLARLAGAFRSEVRAMRRKLREQAVAELYRIGAGRDLGRLLPVELAALPHPLRRRDFLRRYLEGSLAQYDLRGDDERGRGPMVVCIDGSGSMTGAKELWAKAVAIALLDVARRQGRAARAIVFSGLEQAPSAFDLLGRRLGAGGRRPVDLSQVAALANCFPGGGTDFERPLTMALESLGEAKLRRGDIVFITDGEASLPPEFVARFHARKKALEFRVFGVVVDVPAAAGSPADAAAVHRAAQEIGKVADAVTSVSRLTAGALEDLFRAL